jgi:hypothetical protein
MTHCFEDIGISSAAAEVAADASAYFFDGGIRIKAEKTLSCHDLARSTVATLEGIVLQESLLDWSELLTLHQPFKSCNFRSLGFHGEG